MAAFSLFLFLLLLSVQIHFAQAQKSPADDCNGIFLQYVYSSGSILKPTVKKTHQPYRFESALSIVNNGVDELKSWRVFVGFQHDEFLVSASNSVLDDGTSLPAAVGNGTVFAGFPNSDLKTAIETAGDSTQTSARVELVGTQFGVGLGNAPMPSDISLVNDGFICPKPSMQECTDRGNSTMMVCCTKDQKFKANLTKDEEFLPRKDGDLTIMYDITRSYDSNYWAQVTIANHNPLGRLDNWELSWDWIRDEFIYNLQGAYPSVVDSSDCLFGRQGEFYKDLDFSNVLNCERRPTVVDLPVEKANDTALGKVPFCCRNGTILPPAMDPSKSVSAFVMNVFKMPPDLNRSSFTPPQNWKISGRLNPDYECGPPIRVSPSEFPDPSGLLPNKAVFASWQVVCSIITQPKGASPRCCVSFSAYYNDSVIPCSTCACGCPANTAKTCSAKAPELLVPAQSLLVPFENRTKLALAWAGINHFPVPNPLPCADNCGVTINWHLLTDYRGGWSARITLFNWDDSAFADWFAAIELDKAAPGFEKAYSFNGSTLSGIENTIFMQGLPGLNYFVGETDGANPQKDPRVPGKQQSVISFTKKNTPGINVAAGDGFPTKVYFNGEECLLPKNLPKSNSFRVSSSILTSTILALLVLFMLLRL